MVTNSPVSSGSLTNSNQTRIQTEIEIPENVNSNKKKENGISNCNKNSNKNNQQNSSLSTTIKFYNEIEENNSLRNHNNNEASYKSNEHYCSNKDEVEANNNNSNSCHHSKNFSNNLNRLYLKLNLSNLNTRNSYVKTGFALLYAMVSMIFNLFVLATVHERVPIGTKPLSDLSFEIFPRRDWVLNISEYIIMGLFSFVIGMIILHKYRQLLLRRLCLIIGTLYIFRGISMISTVFPLANETYKCNPQMNSTIPITTGEYVKTIFSRVWHVLWGMGLSINGKHDYCGDYMYSGHTVILTLSYLFIREYLFPYRLRTLYLKLANLFFFSCACAGVLCVIISRGHYLIDILVAYYITTRIFWMYHTMAVNQLLMIKSPFNHFSKVWWFPFFQYFEVNCENINNLKGEVLNQNYCSCAQPRYCDCIIANIPRVFEWPLPWPRLLRKRSTLLPCHQRLLPQQHA